MKRFEEGYERLVGGMWEAGSELVDIVGWRHENTIAGWRHENGEEACKCE